MPDLTTWLTENLRPGLVLPVHHEHAGLEWFQLGEVTGVNREKGRFYVKDNGVFFFSGKNCTQPKGPVYVVMPSPEALRAASEGLQSFNGTPSFALRRELTPYEQELARRVSTKTGESDRP